MNEKRASDSLKDQTPSIFPHPINEASPLSRNTFKFNAIIG